MPRPLRLATFNALHGRSLVDGVVRTDRLVAACVSLGADVLGLQEIDRGQTRSGEVDQAAVVASAMHAADWRFVPTLLGEPGQVWRAAADTDDGTDRHDTASGPAYGVGLVSRLPVRSWHVVRLAAARVRAPVGVRRRLAWLQDEPRVGLVAVVDAPFGPLVVATTHLSVVPVWNALQLRRLVSFLGPFPHPAVVLGDLNLFGPLPRWASGWRSLVSVRTFPAANPTVQLDHVLARGRLPPVTAARAVELPLSDHRAVTVDVEVADDRS